MGDDEYDALCKSRNFFLWKAGYSRWLETENRRENWEEAVTRYMSTPLAIAVKENKTNIGEE